jgi:formamidopyrimidine-DNA glycosylase
MPELPEVETMRRGILPVVGSRVEAVQRPRTRRKPIQIRPRIDAIRRRVVGRTIGRVERLGKRMVVVFESDDRLVIEPRMTGLVLIADPPTDEHLRLRLGLSGGAVDELLFWDRRGLGTVRLFSPDEFTRIFNDHYIGPDALEIDVKTLRERLKSSRREIKTALLDQKAVAGVGNLYAAELLHVAGVHPRVACCRLSRRQWAAIHSAMRAVLTEAIRYEGSTLNDGTYRNALNKTGSYQNHHRVYARADQLCPTCRQTNIVRIVQAQRSTFFCPRCQSRRRSEYRSWLASGRQQ